MSEPADDARATTGAADWRARLGGGAIRSILLLLVATCRVRIVHGAEHLDALRAGGRPVVIALWHDRLFFLTHVLYRRFVRRGVPLTALISRSRDGDFGERMALGLGARVVRGSTSRGGSAAVRALLREMRAGRSAVVVVDGPRGPSHEPKPGAATLARLSGAPLLPLSWAGTRTWTLGTWDRMQVPKPFSTIHVTTGGPMAVPRDAKDLAPYSRQLAEALDRLRTVAEASLER
jgi:lysophospholipid acyltransferase (LPLAT)-like uncharacterized protein